MKPLRAVCLAAAILTMAGCRGQLSQEPPVHLNPNMDSQPRYDAQAESAFFADMRTMRTPPKGTVAVGHLHEDDALERGTDASGQVLAHIPVEVDRALLDRGEERYGIYCQPCHDPLGTGAGMVGRRWPIPVPNFHDTARFGANEADPNWVSDGRIFAAITNGFSTMPSYKAQVPDARDRWAIVAYVRTLQHARNVAVADVPADKRGN